MKWSLKLGRILGIDVYLHFTFLLLLAFVGFATWASERSLQAAALWVLFLVALFTCVLLHEFGHALAARQYGIATHDITLLPIGGLARLEKMPDKPAQELWVAVAGPAVNVVIAIGLYLGLSLSGHVGHGNLFAVNGGILEQLLVVNILLVLFNLLPAFPMDGGRVLRALLAMKMDHAKATHIAATIGQGMAILFGFAGLFFNPMLLFIAFFVWVGASQEASISQTKTSLAGARVRDAMLTEFRVLSPANTLADAARMLLAGSQQDFPVLEDGRLVGIVPRRALLEGLRDVGESAAIQAIMAHEFVALDPDEALEAALSRPRAARSSALPVVQQGRLVGLLTAENIGEFFMIRAALGQYHPKSLVSHGGKGAPPVLTRD